MNLNINAASSVQNYNHNHNQFQFGFQENGSDAADLLAQLKGASQDTNTSAKDKLDALVSALNDSDNPALQQLGARASDAAGPDDSNIDEAQAEQLVLQLTDMLKAAQGQLSDAVSQRPAPPQSNRHAGESAVRY